MRTEIRSHNFLPKRAAAIVCRLISAERIDMKVKPIEEIIEFCRPIAKSAGVELVEAEFKQGKNPSLTLFIDKEGGVDLDSCERFHNAVSDPLDELDPTFGLPYTLNVSSLGVDRPFKTDEDFLSHIGKRVEVKLYASMKGKKFYDGILLSYNKDAITLKADEKNTFTIFLKNVVKVNEYVDFE
ncbi:MAG TPA: ribosome maturation factor RimP [Clostridiales bacterium]|nr:ribosome maturation factor RimP [Clostridiales bacterium]